MKKVIHNWFLHVRNAPVSKTDRQCVRILVVLIILGSTYIFGSQNKKSKTVSAHNVEQIVERASQ